MKSQNFEFLRPKRPSLADLGGFAESYAHSDPEGSLLKQRGLVEHLVLAIYEEYSLPLPVPDGLNDLMVAGGFRSSVPEVVQNKLHTVRRAGNHAAHPRRKIQKEQALDCLLQLFEAACWFYLRIDAGKTVSPYAAPRPSSKDTEQTQHELEKLRRAAEEHAAVLAKLEDETKKRLEAERVVEERESELQRLKDEGQQVASRLHFNEATTRSRLIDQALLAAGWDVGLNGASTDSVRQEVRLYEMPSETGDGIADYVLYGDDDKPLAVVEAKRTARDPKVGAIQARNYAACLEKDSGVRPVIFYTNGVDIYLWDDAQGYPERTIYGFYSKDSLEYLHYQRKHKLQLGNVEKNLSIADRMYQLEAVTRVCERFSNKHRKSLVVQATGTGKTRVALSLCDVLLRASWAKRILFLCDRRELRRQADRVFKEFLPGEPRVTVTQDTANDRNKRIYLATYPAIMNCYETFDVGFFDLIIADESHRSIYNKFRAPFLYFDALQLGLTATPVDYIDRNTYGLFGCRDRDPTAAFQLKDALSSTPPYLVPFRVKDCSTWARTEGFAFRGMNAEQKRQLVQQIENAEEVDYTPEQLDRDVFNKGTTRKVFETLMEEGIREVTGSRVGKTIIFARSHKHAEHLAEVFTELYPQYGSDFCRVIDNEEPKAEQLIDDFRNPDNKLTIAISVDMLDTGIDVHEIVNLVFAKPVKSLVKFWQMIGRGTRLCKDLFGPGRDKTEFLIFDHWSNFRYFDEEYREPAQTVQKSLLQRLFEERLAGAAAALESMNEPVFQATVDLIVHDVRAVLDANCIEVRSHWLELEKLSERERVAQFEAVTVADLQSIAAPLMQWRDIRDNEDAYRFDLLMTRLEVALLRGAPDAPRVLDLKDHVLEQVDLLMKNQNPVKERTETIQRVRNREFWAHVTVPQLEEVRRDLRGIMKYQEQRARARLLPRVFDVDDTNARSEDYIPRLEGLELIEYRRRVESVLLQKFADSPILQRIRSGRAVTEDELDELARLVLESDDKANVKHLAGHDPQTRRSLLAVFRGLVGIDAEAVAQAFTSFVHKHPQLSPQQFRFLQMLQNYIAQNGGIELERLYEAPFTSVHAESMDGIFTNPGEVDELLTILSAFEPKTAPPSDLPPASQAS